MDSDRNLGDNGSDWPNSPELVADDFRAVAKFLDIHDNVFSDTKLYGGKW